MLGFAFTLVATHADEPGLLVAARRNSPLVVGIGDGEFEMLGRDAVCERRGLGERDAGSEAQMVGVLFNAAKTFHPPEPDHFIERLQALGHP